MILLCVVLGFVPLSRPLEGGVRCVNVDLNRYDCKEEEAEFDCTNKVSKRAEEAVPIGPMEKALRRVIRNK